MSTEPWDQAKLNNLADKLAAELNGKLTRDEIAVLRAIFGLAAAATDSQAVGDSFGSFRPGTLPPNEPPDDGGSWIYRCPIEPAPEPAEPAPEPIEPTGPPVERPKPPQPEPPDGPDGIY